MSSATAFAPLLTPILDDSMEVSTSPAGNHYDDEVLIDYDDYGTATLTEDEHMIEDGDPMRPGTATDDMMEDAEPRSPVNEEIMQDDPVAVAPDSYNEDEELIDYSDEDYQEDTQIALDDSTVQIAEIQELDPIVSAENVIESEAVDEVVAQPQDEELIAEEPTANFLSAVEQDNVLDASTSEEAAAAVTVPDDDQTANVQQNDAANELSRQIDAEEAAAQELGVQAFEADEPEVQQTDPSDDQQAHEEVEELKNPPKFPGGLDTTAYFAPDGPQTPSDTGIHPTTIRYGDMVMPLFKSRSQPDGLLKDDNLASVSLGDLLDNCRTRLALKIGESISADQELVLNFENMGLQLVEVCSCSHLSTWAPLTVMQHSPHAFGTSLDDVLGVYMHLHRNDSAQPIPPLALSLSLQLKFTSSFNILKAAAEQGDGMSRFAYLRGGRDELDEYDEEGEAEEEGHEEENEHVEEYHNDEAPGEEQHYEGEDGHTEDHTDGQVSHLEEGEEYEEEQYPENHDGNSEDADQSCDAHQDDANYGEYNERPEADPNAEAEELRDDGEYPDEGADVQDDQSNGEAPEHEVEQLDGTALEESEEPVRPESAASSATVRGDVTNDPAGEYYDDDFIDFGDDDLTTETAELHVDDVNGNSSTLDDDYDSVGVAADDADAHHEQQTDATGDGLALDSDFGGLANQRSNEDLDGEVSEEVGAAQELHNEADNGVEQHGQDGDALADSLDLNEDDLPAEDDEQLDTAFDLLEGHDFEHAAENGEPAQPAESLEYDDDDDIGFNDDVEETVLASGSPLGKRSFDEHVGKNGVAEEHESKKVRS